MYLTVCPILGLGSKGLFRFSCVRLSNTSFSSEWQMSSQIHLCTHKCYYTMAENIRYFVWHERASIKTEMIGTLVCFECRALRSGADMCSELFLAGGGGFTSTRTLGKCSCPAPGELSETQAAKWMQWLLLIDVSSLTARVAMVACGWSGWEQMGCVFLLMVLVWRRGC